MKNFIFLFALMTSVQVFAVQPQCEYVGYGNSFRGWIDHCHHIQTPNDKYPISVGCNLTLKEGIKATAQALHSLETQGVCRVEPSDCTVGAVAERPRHSPTSGSVAAIWIKSDLETKTYASFFEYSYESGENFYLSIRKPPGTFFCGGGCPFAPGVAALTEAREAFELLVQEGICKPQQFPVTCRSIKWDGIFYVGSDIWHHFNIGQMAGYISIYEKAGICKPEEP